MIAVLPLTGIGEVHPGADLAALIGAALDGSDSRPGDVLVVTQKIVSKAEGRFARLDAVTPSAQALRLAEITRKDPSLVELVLAESSEILRAVPNVLIARHRLGLVMANAGIDRSNIGPGSDDRALLLPIDPDASAAGLRALLLPRFGGKLGIVISDSFGRPWRYGVVNIAIGAAGLPALLDRRGEPDRDGRPLEVTQIALADMIATAAGLSMGEGAEGVPVVLVRGVQWGEAPPSTAAAVTRPLAEDLFP